MGMNGWIDDKLFVDCRVLYDCADEEVDIWYDVEWCMIVDNISGYLSR
jgi:hypothetical protein